jgi:hypothetical protein
MNVEGMALDGDGATQVVLTAHGRCLRAERAQLCRLTWTTESAAAASTPTTSGRSPSCAAFENLVAAGCDASRHDRTPVAAALPQANRPERLRQPTGVWVGRRREREATGKGRLTWLADSTQRHRANGQSKRG